MVVGAGRGLGALVVVDAAVVVGAAVVEEATVVLGAAVVAHRRRGRVRSRRRGARRRSGGVGRRRGVARRRRGVGGTVESLVAAGSVAVVAATVESAGVTVSALSSPPERPLATNHAPPANATTAAAPTAIRRIERPPASSSPLIFVHAHRLLEPRSTGARYAPRRDDLSRCSAEQGTQHTRCFLRRPPSPRSTTRAILPRRVRRRGPISGSGPEIHLAPRLATTTRNVLATMRRSWASDQLST